MKKCILFTLLCALALPLLVALAIYAFCYAISVYTYQKKEL